MNRHTRLAVAALALVVALLIAATISFSANISQKSGAPKSDVSDAAVDTNGNTIVEGENRLYGVMDSAGNMIIDTQWNALTFLSSDNLSATRETSDGMQTGVLDLEGNVVIPFVFETVQALTDSCYLARLTDDGECVLFDNAFRATDAMVWDDCTWEKPQLTLQKGDDTFLYSLEQEQARLVGFTLSRETEHTSFTANVGKTEADLLTPEEWIDSADRIAAFLEMVKQQDFSQLTTLMAQENENSILGSVALPDTKVLRIDTSLQVQTDASAIDNPTLIWSVGVTARTAENKSQSKMLTVKMNKDTQETWMITEAIFA